MSNDIAWVEGYLACLFPAGRRLAFRDPLLKDEALWFRRAIEEGVIVVRSCSAKCKANTDPEHPRRDEFIVPHQSDRIRHLLTFESEGGVTVSREYVPHIAAYARAILGLGYPRERSSFSRYRQFGEATAKRTGKAGCETDAEFYGVDGESVYLHVEAKRDTAQVDKIAQDIRRVGTLGRLPQNAAKELDYVLDIAPRYLWLVGPGTVDPERYVYEVSVSGDDASFSAVDALPSPPG